ncbi:MAG: outer membrane protein assembly factor BamE [Methylovulum sp.]|nr:outer membrane protein assembly factor BamE [Methylovulum sp.]
MSKPFFSLSLLAGLSLASCSTVLNNLPGVYTLEIQQGNIVEQPMVEQLRPGMNKRQVLYIMGSPMLTDVFHPERWDYIYYDKSDDEEKVQKKVSLFFNNEQLSGIQGNMRPSGKPVIKSSGETTVDIPKRDLERTLWEKVTGLLGYGDTSKNEPDNLKPAPSGSDY